MYNLPVKLSVLSEPYFPLSPQVFLDRSPMDALQVFKQVLPEPVLQAISFAFSDRAILLLLEREFAVEVAKRRLVFLKSQLDAESWLLVNGMTDPPDMSPHAEVLEKLTEALWHPAIALDSAPADLDQRIRLRRELKTLLSLYWIKYGGQDPEALAWLQTPRGMHRFLSLVVAESVYKADGAQALFGPHVAYTGLWLQKQQQFYHYAQLWQRNVTSLRQSA